MRHPSRVVRAWWQLVQLGFRITRVDYRGVLFSEEQLWRLNVVYQGEGPFQAIDTIAWDVFDYWSAVRAFEQCFLEDRAPEADRIRFSVCLAGAGTGGGSRTGVVPIEWECCARSKNRDGDSLKRVVADWDTGRRLGVVPCLVKVNGSKLKAAELGNLREWLFAGAAYNSRLSSPEAVETAFRRVLVEGEGAYEHLGV